MINLFENKDLNEVIINLLKKTQEDEMNYFYRGVFTKNITPQILALAEKNIDKTELSSKIKKRVFHIMVESLQNITRHQESVTDAKEEAAFFAIQRRNNNYFVTTGNIIEKSNIESLKGKLDKVNSLDKEELSNLYRDILYNGSLSDKGGAGLGLIEMVRKSGNKLGFDFIDFNENLSYFYLHTNISASDSGDDSSVQVSDESLREAISFHEFLIYHDIIFIFEGIFEQESLVTLSSLLESQMTGKMTFVKRIVNTMVEIIQNIIHHGERINQSFKGNHGIFYISQKNNNFYLNSGNYILNEMIPRFIEKLEHVNQLNDEGLEDFYDHRLLDFEINSSKEAGLGIIEMRLKTENRLTYKFVKLNETYSLYSLQTCIEKK